MSADTPNRPAISPDRKGQVVRRAVYGVLVTSAVSAIFIGDQLWMAWHDGDAPLWAPLLVPAVFTVFLAVYIVDRWLLVQRHRYPLSRALFQVAFALLFLTLLLPRQASELRQFRPPDNNGPREPALFLLSNADDAVRAATCSLLLGKFPAEVYERVAHLAHSDTSPIVRTYCTRALERLHHAAQPD